MAVGTGAFDVAIVETPEGWIVRIADATGAVLLERRCRDGSEARTFASTVRQHLYWLSADRFSQYYSLET